MSNNKTMSYISAYAASLLRFITALNVSKDGITRVRNHLLSSSGIFAGNNRQQYTDLDIDSTVDILLAPLTINNLLNSEFYTWFSEFTDAEGCFSFAYRTASTTACSFELCIALHRDEAPLLTALQRRLN